MLLLVDNTTSYSNIHLSSHSRTIVDFLAQMPLQNEKANTVSRAFITAGMKNCVFDIKSPFTSEMYKVSL